MPTYEYICQKCQHQFELHQSMSEEPLTVCPEDHCQQKAWGKGKVKRLIGGGAGLIFKGSGFYITDYRSKEYKESAKKDTAAPAASSSDSKSSGSTAKKESSPAKPESSSKT